MSSVLISGKADTLHLLGEPTIITSHAESVKLFGENDLTNAYLVAEQMGVEKIWLVNLQEQNDHIDLVEIIENVDADYFAPLDIYINSKFYDLISKRNITYAEDYVNRTSPFMRTTIIYTYKHASLYEDIDAYLQESISAYESVYKKLSATPYAAQAIYVANNLMNYPFANVVLACLLAKTPVLDYPTSKVLGDVVFDLSIEDVGNREMVYFRRNIEGVMAPENLLNFAPINMPTKNVMVDRLIRHIDTTLNLDQYVGRLYRPYIQSLIRSDVNLSLEDLKASGYINDYEIGGIDFIKENDFTYTVRVNTDIAIPFTTERININFESGEKDE